MTDLSPEIMAQLSAMPEHEWSALAAKVRTPDNSEQLRTIAGRTITDPAALDAFVRAADLSKFVGDTGEVDEQKVIGHLTAMFGGQQSQANWGQGSGGGPTQFPGDGGKVAASKRFGTPMPDSHAGGVAGRGAAGKAAAQKRFAPTEEKQQ